jgi:hypothetical protein
VPRTHAFIVALSLAFAAVAGTVALTRTVHLGQAAAGSGVSPAVVAGRKAQLDRFEASLRAQLRHMPPTVPKVPTTPVAAPSSTPPAAPAPSVQRVVYVRPPTIVIHKHRAGGEHEGSDHGDGGGGRDD